MRHFFAIVGALLLAVLLFVGFNAYQRGIALATLRPATVLEWVNEWRSADRTATADSPTQVDVVPVEEDSFSYEERLEKGNYFLDRGFLTLAANEYVKATHLNPQSSAPYLKLTKTYLGLGNLEKARSHVDALLLLSPGSFEGRYLLSQIHLKQGVFAEAQTLLMGLKEESQDPQLDYDLALTFIALEDTEQAKTLLEASQLKEIPEALQTSIQTLLDAYKEFEFAQAAEPLYLNELLARALNENEAYELAIFKLKTILKTRGDLRDAWIMLGFSYLNLEKYYFALTSFERAYEIDSEWPATQYFLGVTHKELKQFEDAIVYFNYALSNGFDPALVVQRELADLYLDTKDYASAVAAYQKVIEMSEGDINAFVRPIWLYLDFLSQPGEALKLAQLAVISFPDNAMAYNLLGWAQTGTGDFTKAKTHLDKALELDPTLPAAHLNLGKWHEAKGQNELAMKTYQKAYDLDPNGSIGRTAAERYNILMQQTN